MYEKFKSYLADDSLFIGVLLIMVSLTSFGLGRQSVQVNDSNLAPAGISISDSSNVVDNKAFFNENSKERVVVSKSGTKYHLLDCPGANQIKDSNKVYFDSIELAKAAGYTPAANCPGLN